jgi:flagellin-like hook-associated protein FlgL
MAFNDISLTSGMRNNLVSLQDTVSLLNRTQDRLSSGKKVNTALDNPTAFFAAQALNNRASDLAGLKDGMGQAIQTIKAADAGIKGATTLLAAAKGLAQSAATAAAADAVVLGTQADALMAQLDTLVADSGYQGKNLINGQDLAVKFETTSLSIAGVTADSATLGIATADFTTTAGIDAFISSIGVALSTLRTDSSALSGNLSVIQARQDFTTSMMNVLTQGSDSLTLADMNEEGANMLMLQTRQSLGTTALSLSAQAAQSVLKLF